MVEVQSDSYVDPSLEHVDMFGRLVAEIVYFRWCSGASAPLWSEVFHSSEVSNFMTAEGFSNLRPRMEALMRRAAGRGWIVYSEERQSLRAGPTYLASTRRKLRVRQPHEVGRRIAHAVARFRDERGRNPTIKEFAEYLQRGRVQRNLNDEAELLKSLPWLAVLGWIVVDNGRICCGSAAIADSDERPAMSGLSRAGAASGLVDTQMAAKAYPGGMACGVAQLVPVSS
jgi:hypothetical protein